MVLRNSILNSRLTLRWVPSRPSVNRVSNPLFTKVKAKAILEICCQENFLTFIISGFFKPSPLKAMTSKWYFQFLLRRKISEWYSCSEWVKLVPKYSLISKVSWCKIVQLILLTHDSFGFYLCDICNGAVLDENGVESIAYDFLFYFWFRWSYYRYWWVSLFSLAKLSLETDKRLSHAQMILSSTEESTIDVIFRIA